MGNTKRKKSKGEQDNRVAAWDNKRKKSKGEQGDRAAAGVLEKEE